MYISTRSQFSHKMKLSIGGARVNYIEMLSYLGIGGAHPGGLSLTKSIVEHEGLPISSHILDAGCGTGQTANYLFMLGYNVTGIDQNPIMIEHALKRNKSTNLSVPFFIQNLEKTTFESETFDCVLCESVLSFTSLAKTLPEIRRVLTKDGLLIAIELIQIGELSKNEKKKLTSFYHFSSILSEGEWIQKFLTHQFRVKSILSPQDFTFENEPITEFSLSENIPKETFNVLSDHERISEEYKHKLSYRVFILNKS